MFEQINKKEPVLLCGPTASGKSRLAMKLAKEIDGIIINADALQVYKDWRVLTARPTLTDERKIGHFLYGTVLMQEHYSVGNWLNDIKVILEDYKDTPKIIVGGTGLYFTSLINGLADIPATNAKNRKRINSWYLSDGLEALTKCLKKHDPETFRITDSSNPARVLRALEILFQTGTGLSEWQQKHTKPIIDFSINNSFVLNIEVNKLNNRITKRFKNMINNGAVDEVKNNKSLWKQELPAFKAIGSKEILNYINKEITLDEAIDKSIIRTRQYAKRQRTWFRSKMKNWTQINV